MNKLARSMVKLVREEGLSQEQAMEGLNLVANLRGEKYWQRLTNKYPAPLIQRAFEWAQYSLPPRRLQSLTGEKLIHHYMAECPEQCSSDELALRFNKDGRPAKFLHNDLNREIDVDRLYTDDAGNLQEAPPDKKVVEPVRLPSMAEVERMSASDLKNVIDQVQATGQEVE